MRIPRSDSPARRKTQAFAAERGRLSKSAANRVRERLMFLYGVTGSRATILGGATRSCRSLPCYFSPMIALVLVLSGCAAGDAFAMRPRANEVRTVVPITDDGKTLTILNGMVYYDRPIRYQHGIRFPTGRYTLEAQDSSYWYLRAPTPIEFRDFERGRQDEKPTTSRSSPGGIALAKSALNLSIPAGAYVDGDQGTRVIVWILGGDFILREGHDWSKTF